MMTNTDWNAEIYDLQHRFVSVYGQDLMNWLPITAGYSVVDLGCGTGHLSQIMENMGAKVIGIDASKQMIAMAEQNYPNIQFEVQDATEFTLTEPVDAVFSNATLHWIHNQDGVLHAVHQNLKPKGYFVFEMGAKDNVILIREAIQKVFLAENLEFEDNYWYFPSLNEYAALLDKYGFEIKQAALFERPTQLIGEQGMKNWLDQFAHFYFEDYPLAKKNELINKISDELAPVLYHDGQWTADYKRLRIQAIKK